MQPIRLLDLGLVSPVRSQSVYHAVAHAFSADTPDTIILVGSQRPYVCIGYHQDLEREVDLAYCSAAGLPVYRREVGGGAVYLDAGQIFVQWVFRCECVPESIEEKFAFYIRPLVETYRALGVAAFHRPVNDIQVAGADGRGKKIGGTGVAQIGEAEVLVGSLMFTFDKATMARVLKVASEKMRDKVFESLDQYMTTLAEQLDPAPDRSLVCRIYLAQAAKLLGREITTGQLSAAEVSMAQALDEQFESEAWLHQKGSLRRAGVKIQQDVEVSEGVYKAPGGLVRSTLRLREGRIDGLELAGDFTVLPASAVNALQESALGTEMDRESLRVRFGDVYRELRIQSPGLSPADLADAVLAARAIQNG